MVGGMDGGQMDGGPCRTSILCVQKFGHSAATLNPGGGAERPPVQLCRATLGAARIPPLMPRPGARPGSSGRVACILSDPSLCAV